MIDYPEFGNEMMGYLQRLNVEENEKHAGEIIVSLLRMAEALRMEKKWDKAIECCEHGLKVADEKWMGGNEISHNYSKGLISTWLATIYLSKENVNTAVEYYEEAAKHFRGDTPSRVQEESIVRMILSKIYVQTNQWAKALGASQHSLNASSVLSSRRDEKTLELVRLIKGEVGNITEQLHDHLAQQEDTGEGFGAKKVVSLPIYQKHVEAGYRVDTLALDKEYADGASLVFEASEETELPQKTIKDRDLILIRPLPSIVRNELVLVSLQEEVGNKKTAFMYMTPKDNHYCLLSPSSSKGEKLRLFVVFGGTQASKEEIEPLYESHDPKPKYVDSQDLAIHGKVVRLIRQEIS